MFIIASIFSFKHIYNCVKKKKKTNLRLLKYMIENLTFKPTTY